MKLATTFGIITAAVRDEVWGVSGAKDAHGDGWRSERCQLSRSLKFDKPTHTCPAMTPRAFNAAVRKDTTAASLRRRIAFPKPPSSTMPVVSMKLPDTRDDAEVPTDASCRQEMRRPEVTGHVLRRRLRFSTLPAASSTLKLLVLLSRALSCGGATFGTCALGVEALAGFEPTLSKDGLVESATSQSCANAALAILMLRSPNFLDALRLLVPEES